MCDATPSATIVLPPRPESAREARAFLLDRHCHEHGAEVLEAAVLLVSELVSNAVRYGDPPVRVEIDCDATHAMQVRVSDGSPLLPEPKDVPDDAESGRGLRILRVLSDAWGVVPGGDGKTVWFRVVPSDQGTRDLTKMTDHEGSQASTS